MSVPRKADNLKNIDILPNIVTFLHTEPLTFGKGRQCMTLSYLMFICFSLPPKCYYNQIRNHLKGKYGDFDIFC